MRHRLDMDMFNSGFQFSDDILRGVKERCIGCPHRTHMSRDCGKCNTDPYQPEEISIGGVEIDSMFLLLPNRMR